MSVLHGWCTFRASLGRIWGMDLGHRFKERTWDMDLGHGLGARICGMDLGHVGGPSGAWVWGMDLRHIWGTGLGYGLGERLGTFRARVWGTLGTRVWSMDLWHVCGMFGARLGHAVVLLYRTGAGWYAELSEVWHLDVLSHCTTLHCLVLHFAVIRSDAKSATSAQSAFHTKISCAAS